ncbi:DUF7222 domain-containing protein [Aliarcobacter butzleri]|uniref:DUF7222 domain-containing protein n=1 Tax=Aliarcobacter butzleri TaxID=28197 RepID=UPI0021B461E0|nr:hypothetical protein [Aliarcobacter butzleri]MCT7596127.1 hypothetical protein [Aliarcobacter butzleri]
MTISKIKNYKVETGLEKEVKKIILNNVNKDYIESFFNDLLQYGCVSGMVSELVYYSDTLKFFKKHKEDINDLLKETLANHGRNANPADIFGEKFDSEDVLCLDTNNQNLLTWFAFEETSRIIANNLGMEI